MCKHCEVLSVVTSSPYVLAHDKLKEDKLADVMGFHDFAMRELRHRGFGKIVQEELKDEYAVPVYARADYMEAVKFVKIGKQIIEPIDVAILKEVGHMMPALLSKINEVFDMQNKMAIALAEHAKAINGCLGRVIELEK